MFSKCLSTTIMVKEEKSPSLSKEATCKDPQALRNSKGFLACSKNWGEGKSKLSRYCDICSQNHLRVSINGGIPKSFISIGFFHINRHLCSYFMETLTSTSWNRSCIASKKWGLQAVSLIDMEEHKENSSLQQIRTRTGLLTWMAGNLWIKTMGFL